jgi:hypothetical protein
MKTKSESAFVKVLETNDLTDIALIKSALDRTDVRYFIQGENMMFIRPVTGPAILMVAGEEVEEAVKLLKPLKLRFMRMIFQKQPKS